MRSRRRSTHQARIHGLEGALRREKEREDELIDRISYLQAQVVNLQSWAGFLRYKMGFWAINQADQIVQGGKN